MVLARGANGSMRGRDTVASRGDAFDGRDDPDGVDAPGGFRSAAARPALPDGMRAEQVRGLYAYTGSSLLGNGLGAGIVGWLFAGTAAAGQVTGWLGAFALVWLARLGLALAHRRADAVSPLGDQASQRWRRRWNAGALASGTLWGFAAWQFYGAGDAVQRAALLLVVNGLCVGSIPSLATQGRVYLAYLALAIVPAIARVLAEGDPNGLWLATVMALILVTAALLGRNFHTAFRHLLQLRSRTRQLIAELRDETAAADRARATAEGARVEAEGARIEADRARAEAEAANQAKTRFFAAASHDLRQPLHALALFAGALRTANRDAPLAPLVARVGESVEALDRLFTELLDITRIDAGGVDPRPCDFALDEVYQRLRPHMEPVAFEKGLLLVLRGGHRRVHADPLLVERILRNLMANALRCTHDGGVLVAARPRGDQVLLQVWDSGIGIAPADQARIFDEFVQVAEGPGTASAPRRQGLGLGLAIVRRLAALSGAGLVLRSVPGHGSVFSLTLPAAPAQADTAAPEERAAQGPA
ncbi:HAMP domain-containing sensor histidine kinase [Ideonella sp. A 288]|uniref:sensor histidine kinase n=1 Tax=Ideonella sp. A 288 TaxID=1962181 RepID=UPI001F43E079|nr:HAMP domain-containing sensor histidine kinase [Ideonella sp. A 288]